MSIAATVCPSCGVQNLSSAKFCGGCGAAVGSASAVPSNGMPANQMSPGGTMPINASSDWRPMASVICGVLSILLCGPFTALPGLYFGWVSMSTAKSTGQPTTFPMIGIGTNVVGMIVSAIVFMFGMLLMLTGMSGY